MNLTKMQVVMRRVRREGRLITTKKIFLIRKISTCIGVYLIFMDKSIINLLLT